MTPIEKEIEGIVDGILEDYRHGRDIDKLDPFQHPDKAVVIDMIGKLLRIVYPGSSRDKAYRIYNTKHNLSMLIEDVMYNLNKQIAIALRVGMTEREAQETSGRWPRQTWRHFTTVTPLRSARTRSSSATPDCLPSRCTGWRTCCIC